MTSFLQLLGLHSHRGSMEPQSLTSSPGRRAAKFTSKAAPEDRLAGRGKVNNPGLPHFQRPPSATPGRSFADVLNGTALPPSATAGAAAPRGTFAEVSRPPERRPAPPPNSAELRAARHADAEYRAARAAAILEGRDPAAVSRPARGSAAPALPPPPAAQIAARELSARRLLAAVEKANRRPT